MKKLSRNKVNGLRSTARIGKSRSGFTLVELLVVIAIIGVLVGLTVPAVFAVRGVFNRAAIKMELEGIAQAFENYKSKYGEYPPDGSSWPHFESHLRKCFQNISQAEIDLFNPALSPNVFPQVGGVADVRNDSDATFTGANPLGRVMEPAEALVLFLGGLSSDSQRPFTGEGGPFRATGNNQQPFEYNSARQNSLWEFDSRRLTVETVQGFQVSTDEVLFAKVSTSNNHQNSIFNDLLPVYMSRYTEPRNGSPYVYFNSQTYQFPKGNAMFYNYFQPSGLAAEAGGAARDVSKFYGAARPVLSESVDATVPGNVKPQKYMNDSTFQVLSPGGDGCFGGRTATRILSNNRPLILFTIAGTPCYINTQLESPVIKSSMVKGNYVTGGGPLILDEFIVGSNIRYRPGHDDVGNFGEASNLGESINNN